LFDVLDQRYKLQAFRFGQAAGDFVNEATSLQSRAWLAVLFAQNGSSPDYLTRTMQAIQNTNAADLQRVARTYMGNPTIALVLPRQK